MMQGYVMVQSGKKAGPSPEFAVPDRKPKQFQLKTFDCSKYKLKQTVSFILQLFP